MSKWGQNSKPKKIPRASNKTQKYLWNQKLTPKKFHAEFLSVKKKFGWTLIAKLRRWDTRALPWIFRLFWIVKKNPYLNQDTCQIFLLKKLPESKISNPKKPFDHPCHLKSRVTLWALKTRYRIQSFLQANT